MCNQVNIVTYSDIKYQNTINQILSKAILMLYVKVTFHKGDGRGGSRPPSEGVRRRTPIHATNVYQFRHVLSKNFSRASVRETQTKETTCGSPKKLLWDL